MFLWNVPGTGLGLGPGSEAHVERLIRRSTHRSVSSVHLAASDVNPPKKNDKFFYIGQGTSTKSMGSFECTDVRLQLIILLT